MSKKIEYQVLTYAQIVDRIGSFADLHMDGLSPEQKLDLMFACKEFAEIAKRKGLGAEQVIALCLSLAVEFMRFQPEYQLTKNKTVEEISAEFVEPEVCRSPLVN